MTSSKIPRCLARGLAGPLLAACALLAAACDRGGPEGAIALPDRPATADARGLVVVDTEGDRPTYWDFGNVSFGSQPSHVFRVRNTESRPVTVLDLLPSCSCTMPRVSVTAADGTQVQGNTGHDGPVIVVPPGAIAEIAIRIDTTRVERMNADKLAQVRLRSDATTAPYLTFELHLLVERDLRALPDVLDLGLSPQHAPRTGRADLVRDLATTSAKVTEVEAVDGPFAASLDTTEVQGNPLWVLTVTPKAGLGLGPISGSVRVGTTQRDGKGHGAPITVPVRAQVVRELALEPPVLLFGTTAPGAPPVVARLEALVPGERFRVLSAKLEGPGSEGLTLSCQALDQPAGVAEDASPEAPPSSSWQISLAVTDRMKEREFSGRLVIETDHPSCPLVTATYAGTLR